MEQTFDLIELLQSVVLQPNLLSATILFFLSFLNEIIAIFPYAVVLSGQLLFLDEPLTLALLAKLFVFVAIPVSIGSSLGTLPVYAITYYGGKPAIEKLEKYLRFSWRDVEKISNRFKGAWYDEVIFLLLRSIPLLPSLPINVAVGILRMRFWPYFLLTVIGFTVRMMLTLLVVGVGAHGLSRFIIFFYTN